MYYSYKKENEPRVSLIYSVYHEMICSLHVLFNSEHHNSRYEWSENIKVKMSEEDIKTIDNYGQLTNEWFNLLEFINKEEHWNLGVAEILDRIGKMDLLGYYYSFFGERYSKNVIERALVSFNIAPEIEKRHKYIFEGAQKERKVLLDFLKRYYYEYFAKEISYMEPMYIRKLEHQYNTVREGDIYEYINTLHPRIEDTEEKVNFHKYRLFEVYKKDVVDIFIFETSFIMPHLLLGIFQRGFSLTFPIYMAKYDINQVPKDRVEVLKAVADSTRLQIVKMLYEGSKSTQLLAERLEISEAGVSRHLKILYNAKIVSKERDGNYVNYHLNINMIDNLVYLLYEVIS